MLRRNTFKFLHFHNPIHNIIWRKNIVFGDEHAQIYWNAELSCSKVCLRVLLNQCDSSNTHVFPHSTIGSPLNSCTSESVLKPYIVICIVILEYTTRLHKLKTTMLTEPRSFLRHWKICDCVNSLMDPVIPTKKMQFIFVCSSLLLFCWWCLEYS